MGQNTLCLQHSFSLPLHPQQLQWKCMINFSQKQKMPLKLKTILLPGTILFFWCLKWLTLEGIKIVCFPKIKDSFSIIFSDCQNQKHRYHHTKSFFKRDWVILQQEVLTATSHSWQEKQIICEGAPRQHKLFQQWLMRLCFWRTLNVCADNAGNFLCYFPPFPSKLSGKQLGPLDSDSYTAPEYANMASPDNLTVRPLIWYIEV